jgi:hypothetical protein
MDERHQALILNLLFPRNNTAKQLESALSILEQAQPEQAKKAIWRAGLQLSQFCTKAERYPTLPIKLQKSGSQPSSSLHEVVEALAESDKFLNEFVQHPTINNGTNLCIADRRTVLLLFLASEEHDIRDMIDQFLQHAVRVVGVYATLSKIVPAGKDETRHNFLNRRAEEEELRIRLLRAMLNNDSNEARNLLIKAIEHAEQLNQAQKSSKTEHPP